VIFSEKIIFAMGTVDLPYPALRADLNSDTLLFGRGAILDNPFQTV
jgi:hypothetical protein